MQNSSVQIYCGWTSIVIFGACMMQIEFFPDFGSNTTFMGVPLNLVTWIGGALFIVIFLIVDGFRVMRASEEKQ